MKYHTAVKFIAIVLCAAALLGMVGSGAGIAALTGLDLFDKTPEQYMEGKAWETGSYYADHIARNYASINLGGLHPDALYNTGGNYHPFSEPYYSYELLDAEGNVLERGGFDAETEFIATYTYPVSGKYLYVVSEKPWQDPSLEETEGTYEPAPDETIVLEADPGIMAMDADAPAETVPVTEAPVEDAPAETAAPAEVVAAAAEELPDEDAEADPEEDVEEDAPEDAEEAEPPVDSEETEPPVETEDEAEPEEITEPVTEATEAQPIPETTEATVPGTPAVDSTPSDPPAPISGPTPSLNPTVLPNGHLLSDYNVITERYYNSDLQQDMEMQYIYLDMPAYTVVLHLAEGAVHDDYFLPLLNVLWNVRHQLLPLLCISLALFAIVGVYLCCAAGRGSKSEGIRAAGMNRIPLELYFGITAAAFTLAVLLVAEIGEYLLKQNLQVAIGCFVGIAYFVCLLIVGFLFAVVAQMKTPGRFWLRNSLCGHCLRLLVWGWNKFIDGCIWLAQVADKHVIPLLCHWLRSVWQLVCRILRWIWGVLTGTVRFIRDRVNHFMSLLPLTWQWLLVGVFMVLLLAMLCSTRSAFGVFIGLVVTIGFVLLGSSSFGTLLDATKRMSKGDLNAKIDERRLYGCFQDFAKNLNALAGVALVAAQKQLKSERMKTELITNVSHDIKTPLTSIINYVDLLQKAHTEEEQEKYLEVLARQSQQLKKLIEDLIEMSKASTGNLTVDITQVDAVESVNQALGEFADKLDKVQLTPVFRHTEETAPMMADGKLTWRVLHNLLSNAVKYALPGTRLYIDLMQLEGKVILSMKNISREELNVDAEELMERFVRGDGSRNTEGSGLGLNIAKSMMELQHGSLQLLVDGDLFKVTLIFPGA